METTFSRYAAPVDEVERSVRQCVALKTEQLQLITQFALASQGLQQSLL